MRYTPIFTNKTCICVFKNVVFYYKFDDYYDIVSLGRWEIAICVFRVICFLPTALFPLPHVCDMIPNVISFSTISVHTTIRTPYTHCLAIWNGDLISNSTHPTSTYTIQELSGQQNCPYITLNSILEVSLICHQEGAWSSSTCTDI